MVSLDKQQQGPLQSKTGKGQPSALGPEHSKGYGKPHCPSEAEGRQEWQESHAKNSQREGPGHPLPIR